MLTCWRLSQPATSSQGLAALLLGPRAPSIFCEAPSPPRQQMRWKSVFPEAQLFSSIHHSADLFFCHKVLRFVSFWLINVSIFTCSGASV